MIGDPYCLHHPYFFYCTRVRSVLHYRARCGLGSTRKLPASADCPVQNSFFFSQTPELRKNVTDPVTDLLFRWVGRRKGEIQRHWRQFGPCVCRLVWHLNTTPLIHNTQTHTHTQTNTIHPPFSDSQQYYCIRRLCLRPHSPNTHTTHSLYTIYYTKRNK